MEKQLPTRSSSSLVAAALLASVAAPARPAPAPSMGPPAPIKWCNARLSRVLSGTDSDMALGLAVDGSGNVYVCGDTLSPGFPSTAGAFDPTYNGLGDAFVVKLSPTGAILYGTFLGGSGIDGSRSLAISGGSAVVTGYAQGGFPTTAGSFDETYNGGNADIFVAQLSPDGAALVYSTFLGGPAGEYSRSVAVDPAGRAVVVGNSGGLYPTTPGAFSTTKSGFDDAVVTLLSPAGDSLVYSTYLGGSSVDAAFGVALDAAGSAYVAGETLSPDFPTTAGAFQPAMGGGTSDAFVAKLSPSGSSLVYATYLGSSADELAHAIAVEATGSATLTGKTLSQGFPVTAGAFDVTHNGGLDAFVSRLAPTGEALLYSTFLGGTSYEEARGLALDASGVACVAGYTRSSDFPVTAGSCQVVFGGGSSDAFLACLSETGNALGLGTYIGGSGDEIVEELVLAGGLIHAAGTVSRNARDATVLSLP